MIHFEGLDALQIGDMTLRSSIARPCCATTDGPAGNQLSWSWARTAGALGTAVVRLATSGCVRISPERNLNRRPLPTMEKCSTTELSGAGLTSL